MKDLSSLSKTEQDEFFKSFDYVLSDVDGVLWHLQDVIPGATGAISALQSLNKKVIFVSNNSTRTQDDYYKRLKAGGYNIEKSDLVRPTLVIIDFLKKRNFCKEIFLIGMSAMRSELEAAGFKINKFLYENPEESIPVYFQQAMSKDDKVGAVVADLDINMTAADLQKACTLLKNPDTLFITGGSDRRLYFGPGLKLIGPGTFHHIVEEVSGRKPLRLAKPDLELGKYIQEKFGIRDASRVLFIGDSVPEDMGFATNCKYRKLLVLSGLTSKEMLQDWSYPEKLRPDYYVDSLKVLDDLLK